MQTNRQLSLGEIAVYVTAFCVSFALLGFAMSIRSPLWMKEQVVSAFLGATAVAGITGALIAHLSVGRHRIVFGASLGILAAMLLLILFTFGILFFGDRAAPPI